MELVVMPIKIVPEQREVFPVEGSHIFELVHAWNLLRKHAMKPWIDAMRLDGHRDHLAHRFLNREAHRFRQLAADDLHDLLIVTIDDGDDERLLAGEILVERTDAHARHLRDPIRAGLVESLAGENASGRFDERAHRRARSALRGA